ncbi:MAG: VapE family protein [Peptostreptococcaceae bacterium]
MYKQYTDEIKSLRDLETIINYYYPNQITKNKMSCPFHQDKTPSFQIADKGNGAFYKCFGCGVGGDIIDFIKRVEKIEFIEALKKAYYILNKPLSLPKSNITRLNTVNKNNINEFYNEKVKEAINEENLDKAFELSCRQEEENNKKYHINFPYTDEKNKPKKIWENLDELLKQNNITIKYNEIIKDIEITGLEGTNFESQLVDIHSLCYKYGFSLSINKIHAFVNRIANNYPVNPVADYLRDCYMNFDGEMKYIQMLCDALITRNDFNQELKKLLIRKWLLNTATIPFNEGNSNIEGILTLQGKQGIGKTRLIRKLIPIHVKTGLELDPSDKDKVYQCIKYWVCELGELDSTLKKDLAKLKAFITEQIDEFRRPYGLAPVKYPRKTSFYATVNNEEFLKDETGNRRYWVISIEKIDFDNIDKIDIDKLWGEVMHLKEEKLETNYLNQEQIDNLNTSNADFKVMGHLELGINTEFDWDVNRDRWTWKSSTDIANKLHLKSSKGLRANLENNGAVYKKVGNKRGYFTPPYKTLFGHSGL